MALAFSPDGFEGRWTAESKARSKKQGDRTAIQTLDLKIDGSALTGTVSAGRKRAKAVDIRDGKIEGNKFSFTTLRKTKKGEQKMRWEGQLEGDQLKGTVMREGGRRGTPFTAKRAG
jgi:hypothetical protein